MKLLRTTCLSLVFVTAPGLAADAHMHGVGTLDVAVDAGALLLRLEAPLDSLVGFERAPGNDAERAAVRRMAVKLGGARAQFTPTPAARCRPADVRLSSPVLEPDLLTAQPVDAPAADAHAAHDHGSEHDHHHDHHNKPHASHAEPAHAELVADYVFECANPDELNNLDVRLFEHFDRLRRLDAQLVTQDRQAAATLTAEDRRLAW